MVASMALDDVRLAPVISHNTQMAHAVRSLATAQFPAIQPVLPVASGHPALMLELGEGVGQWAMAEQSTQIAGSCVEIDPQQVDVI